MFFGQTLGLDDGAVSDSWACLYPSCTDAQDQDPLR